MGKKKKGSSLFAFLRRAFCSSSSSSKSSRKTMKSQLQPQETKDASQEKIVYMNKEAVSVTPQSAAVVIQSAFRGYLARRALLALQGIVRLQAFIRGHNVRKQAKLTLRCMQALVHLQSQMYEQEARLSHERCRKSMFAESYNLWDRHKKDVRQRKSTSARGCSEANEWDFYPCLMEDDKPVFESRVYTSLKREKALAYAISHQLWRYDSNINNRSEWLTRWMATKKRDSADIEDSIRTIKMNAVVVEANTPPSVSKYSCSNESGSTTPHYMNSTESAKAKARLVSPPNQRHSIPGRERVRKRLSYSVTEQHGYGSDHTDDGSYSQCLKTGETNIKRWLN